VTAQLSQMPIERFNEMVRAYTRSGVHRSLKEIEDYEDFVAKYPVTTKLDLGADVELVRRSGRLPAGYVVASSGTSAEPTVSLCGTWQKDTVGGHALDLRRFVGKHIFARTDVVVNLLAAGGLGSLYEGVNRVLEPLGVTIVAVGRLDAVPDCRQALEVMRTVAADTVIATPSGLVELARACIGFGCVLALRKLVFIGEPLTRERREFLHSVWPDARSYGLYGTTEAGLIGLTTPEDPPDEYLILSRWTFVERDTDGALLLTDLSSPLIPLIRYRVGDIVEPVDPMQGNAITRLRLLGRSDGCFNLVGNLLSPAMIQTAVFGCLMDVAHVQIILTHAPGGRERMHLAVDTGRALIASEDEDRIRRVLMTIPQINEGLARDVLEISVGDRTSQRINGRGKLSDLIDDRRNPMGSIGPSGMQ